MDNLVSILKIPVLNYEVKNKILRLVQTWAIAFEGRGNLGYVGEVYRILQNEGALHVAYFCVLLAYWTPRLQLPATRPSVSHIGDGRHTDSARVDRF